MHGPRVPKRRSAMKRLAAVPFGLVGLVMCSLAIRAEPAPGSANDTLNAIKKELGVVPTFMKSVPDEIVGPAWDEMRTLEMGTETALPVKIKELISLAVSAQVPCRYCIYADTQFAKAAGATERELKEAVGMAAVTR